MSENIAGLLTDDSRIFHRKDCAYDWVYEATGAAFRGNVMTVDLALESGEPMTLSVEAIAPGTVSAFGKDAQRADDGVFRLRAWQGEVTFQETSPMLVPQELKPLPARFRETKDAWTLTSGKNAFRVGKGPFAASFHGGRDRVLWQMESEDRAAGALVAPHLGYRTSEKGTHPFLSWSIGNDERLFGLGEKFNKVEKTGTRCTIWTADTAGLNTTDLAYKAVPVLFSTRGWGMMLHSSFRSFWEVGSFSYIAGSFLTEDDKIDLFLFAGRTLKDLLGKYTALTGRPAMPPKWALGVWLSRCTYPTRAVAEAAAAGMRERKIPADVVHLDPPWMKVGYYPIFGVDACDFDWNEQSFPDRVEMFREFAADGFSVCLWINPYLPEGTAIYEEAKHRGFMVKDRSGNPARNEHGQTVGMVDFTNRAAKEWWKDHLKALLRDGASVFKPDYGERVPEDCIFHNGKSGAEMHNLYLFLYNQAVSEATKEATGRDAIWGRSGYIGSQRFPGTWAGDTQTTWRAMRCCLRGGLSAGLTGFSFWSHDIGGFVGPKPSPELYVRWAQWGLLSPLSRFHGTTPREPWEYGPEAERIVAKYCRLRYSLNPYLLACAQESCRTGVPIMRHMALEFPDEPGAHALDEQYMLGPDLLVAPVLVEGARTRRAYLPAGVWTELQHPLRVYDGGRFVALDAPLDEVPVLVREGAVIPRLLGEPQHLKSGPAKSIAVHVYPGWKLRRLEYEDEGVHVRIRAISAPGRAEFSIDPAPLRVTVLFVDVEAQDVKCRRTKVKWRSSARGTRAEFRADKGARVQLVEPEV